MLNNSTIFHSTYQFIISEKRSEMNDEFIYSNHKQTSSNLIIIYLILI